MGNRGGSYATPRRRDPAVAVYRAARGFSRCSATSCARRRLFCMRPSRLFEPFRRQNGESCDIIADRRLPLWRPAFFRRFRPGRAWSNRRALTWKDYHFLTGGNVIMLAKFAAYGEMVLVLGLVA